MIEENEQSQTKWWKSLLTDFPKPTFMFRCIMNICCCCFIWNILYYTLPAKSFEHPCNFYSNWSILDDFFFSSEYQKVLIACYLLNSGSTMIKAKTGKVSPKITNISISIHAFNIPIYYSFKCLCFTSTKNANGWIVVIHECFRVKLFF